MSEAGPAAAGGPAGDPPAAFGRLDERQVYASRIFTEAEARCRAPDGQVFERSIVRHPGAVAIVAVDERDRAALIRQFRPALDQWVLEIPAGTRDVEGEAPEATARRELAEEVGLSAESLRPLVTVRNSPGFCDQRTVVFLATGLHDTPTARSGAEERFMSTELVHLATVPELVARGQLFDSTSVLGLLLSREALAGRY